MSTRTAVVFGAGKMACGLIGHVLARSGFSVQFVARRPEVVAAINQFGGFQLSIAGQPRPLVIRGCSALPIEDERPGRSPTPTSSSPLSASTISPTSRRRSARACSCAARRAATIR